MTLNMIVMTSIEDFNHQRMLCHVRHYLQICLHCFDTCQRGAAVSRLLLWDAIINKLHVLFELQQKLLHLDWHH